MMVGVWCDEHVLLNPSSMCQHSDIHRNMEHWALRLLILMVVTLPVTVKFPVTVTIVIQILGVNISCTTTSPPGTSGDTRATINNFKSFPSKDDYNSNKKKLFSKCSFHSCYNSDICDYDFIRWSIYVNFIFYLISFTISGFVLYTIKNHASLNVFQPLQDI